MVKRLVKKDADGYITDHAPLTRADLYVSGLPKKVEAKQIGIDAADGNKPVFRNKQVDDFDAALAGGLKDGWEVVEWSDAEKPVWNNLIGCGKVTNGVVNRDLAKEAQIKLDRASADSVAKKRRLEREAVKASLEADKAASMGLTELETQLRAESTAKLADAAKL